MIRKILFIGIFICLLSCGFSELFSTVGNIHDGCSEVLKEHPDRLDISISLGISHNSIYESRLAFDAWSKNNPNPYSGCYIDYEYKFVSEKEKKTIRMNTTLDNVLDSDEHVRFSLFDKNNVEKSYDIDLSEIIHSYTYRGDSVEIKMPENGISKISIECPYCSAHRIYDSLCQGIFACNYQSTEQKSVIVGTDSSWGKSYGFKLYLANQSSMKTDSIFIYGDITFR
ncbi:hypothetical protein [Fibrobacter sp.]|uniref:hypothetical protein n=1 Tax=Fibrobacter sp. TaxID=35828 RepID=UPI0026040A02|nr:hypothetical protein [Fibrobacter sp.]MDD5943510.1 hypothetical protein [Fibrobacter sp.]